MLSSQQRERFWSLTCLECLIGYLLAMWTSGIHIAIACDACIGWNPEQALIDKNLPPQSCTLPHGAVPQPELSKGAGQDLQAEVDGEAAICFGGDQFTLNCRSGLTSFYTQWREDYLPSLSIKNIISHHPKMKPQWINFVASVRLSNLWNMKQAGIGVPCPFLSPVILSFFPFPYALSNLLVYAPLSLKKLINRWKP